MDKDPHAGHMHGALLAGEDLLRGASMGFVIIDDPPRLGPCTYQFVVLVLFTNERHRYVVTALGSRPIIA